MRKNNLTYRKSGVNIKASDKFIDYISLKLNKSKNIDNIKNIGGFGSINKIPGIKKDKLIVTATDGVGTKLEIANELKKFDTIGIDLVAMSVNDLIVQGAKPYLFLDYISIDKINLSKLKQIVDGIIKGCKLAGCDLVGGETAEMPGTYSKGKFDLAGFALGFVDRKKLLTKNKIKENDIILAVPSSGLHSNGFSLIRYLIKKNKIDIKKNKFLKKELITSTKIYVSEILNLIDNKLINGCANITGGGLKDNISRIIPNKLCAELNFDTIKPKKIFNYIKSFGLSDKEMINTFNCGVGFCIITNKKNLGKIDRYFSKEFKPYIIGRIIKNKESVLSHGRINWKN